jgi:hypothetical protein
MMFILFRPTPVVGFYVESSDKRPTQGWSRSDGGFGQMDPMDLG